MIKVTERASSKMHQLIEDEGMADVALRVAVQPGGCHGFNYEMFFDRDIAEDDTVAETCGVRIVVDSASAPYLYGASLDYAEGPYGLGFALENPNGAQTCGCGLSLKFEEPHPAAR